MQKHSKVLLGVVLAVVVLTGAVVALVFETLTNTPDFTQLRSSVEVTFPLPNDKKFTRRVGPRAPGWVGIQSISNDLLMAVIASEDASFYSHDGIDYHELKEAIKKDLKEKRWARGASTITQQLVKNVYLTRQKTLWRKFKEFIWAREIDKVLSKSEILCFYVNLVEWGPGIYGIKQASNHYFGVEPSALTARQSAFLAMLLPSPVRYYSYFRKKQLTDFANRRVAQILRVMNRMGFLDDESYQIALHESLWGEEVPFVDPNLPVPTDLGGEELPVAASPPSSGRPSPNEPVSTSGESLTVPETVTPETFVIENPSTDGPTEELPAGDN